MQPRHLIQNKTPAFVVERFKVRWVCQGFRAKKGYDFFDSYTSNLDYEADRIMTALAVLFSLGILFLTSRIIISLGNYLMPGKKSFIVNFPKDMKSNKPVIGWPRFILDFMVGPPPAKLPNSALKTNFLPLTASLSDFQVRP